MDRFVSLREEVKAAYSAIAERPKENPPFPTGRVLAEALGYASMLLDSLPATSVDAFCGVSNVSLFAEIPPGSTVLDLGCGAGLDTLVAAGRAGEAGRVIAIDFSESMLQRARQAISEVRAANVELHAADAERLPIEDGSVDVAIVNGIFNLNPCRAEIFSELARVLRRGGRVFAAELVLSAAFTREQRADSTNWFS